QAEDGIGDATVTGVQTCALPISIDPSALRAGAPPQPPADSLVALALATHPRLAARRAAVDAATRTIQVERLGARPDFTLSLRYEIGRASGRERGELRGEGEPVEQ